MSQRILPVLALVLLLPVVATAQYTWPFPQTTPQPQTLPDTQPQTQPQAQPQTQPQTQAVSGRLAELLTQAGLKGVTVRDDKSCVVGICVEDTGNKFSVHVFYTENQVRLLTAVFLPYKVQEAAITPDVWRKLGGDWNCTTGPAHVAFLKENDTFCISSGWLAEGATPPVLYELVRATALLADTATEDLKKLMNVQ